MSCKPGAQPTPGLDGSARRPDPCWMTDASALHASLLTLDSHIDIPWPDGPAFADETARRVDLPKMRRGHLAASTAGARDVTKNSV